MVAGYLRFHISLFNMSCDSIYSSIYFQGGDKDTVNCNGPNAEQNSIDMYYGKGLVSKKLYTQIYQTCKFPKVSAACEILLDKASEQVSTVVITLFCPHYAPCNIYHIVYRLVRITCTISTTIAHVFKSTWTAWETKL